MSAKYHNSPLRKLRFSHKWRMILLAKEPLRKGGNETDLDK